jgi:microcompartment protein CcmL/EutN
MKRSIGIIEFRSIAIGIGAVDTIVKASDVGIMDAKTICPGKYYIIFTGSVSAVKSSMGCVMEENEKFIIDQAELSNVYPEIFSALSATSQISQLRSIGIIETLTSPSILVAADSAVKATSVEIIEIRIARALGGKNICIITGDVSSVSESVRVGIKYASEKGFLVDWRVIPSPHQDLYRAVM